MIRRGVTRYQRSASIASSHFPDVIEAERARDVPKSGSEPRRTLPQKGTTFFNPLFFFFLLLEISSSVAWELASALAELLDCPCWSSFTCGGGGSACSVVLWLSGVLGLSSLGSGTAF